MSVYSNEGWCSCCWWRVSIFNSCSRFEKSTYVLTLYLTLFTFLQSYGEGRSQERLSRQVQNKEHPPFPYICL